MIQNALGSIVGEDEAEHSIWTDPARSNRLFYRRGNATWSADFNEVLNFPRYIAPRRHFGDLKLDTDFEHVRAVFREAPEIWTKEP